MGTQYPNHKAKDAKKMTRLGPYSNAPDVALEAFDETYKSISSGLRTGSQEPKDAAHSLLMLAQATKIWANDLGW